MPYSGIAFGWGTTLRKADELGEKSFVQFVADLLSHVRMIPRPSFYFLALVLFTAIRQLYFLRLDHGMRAKE